MKTKFKSMIWPPKNLQILQCCYYKWGHLDNTNQSHRRTKIEILIKGQLRQSKQSMLSFLKDTLIAENGAILG